MKRNLIIIIILFISILVLGSCDLLNPYSTFLDGDGFIVTNAANPSGTHYSGVGLEIYNIAHTVDAPTDNGAILNHLDFTVTNNGTEDIYRPAFINFTANLASGKQLKYDFALEEGITMPFPTTTKEDYVGKVAYSFSTDPIVSVTIISLDCELKDGTEKLVNATGDLTFTF